MQIVFAGGGSGGHFYPIIAVAQELHAVCEERNLILPDMHYCAPEPFDEQALFDLEIAYHYVPAGKLRRYASLKNITDFWHTASGSMLALWRLFRLYPDVVFSKGGYASFPIVLAARMLRIPVVIHESDTKPGIVNRWAAQFARRIAVSYPDAADAFPESVHERIAHTGNPIRRQIRTPSPEGGREFLELEQGVPVICVLSGSQGAQAINDTVIDALPELVQSYQIVHQTGDRHYEDISQLADVVLDGNDNAHRYVPYGYLNPLAMRMMAGAANLIITRAGSTIFEVARWGIPAIVVPLPGSGSDHQRSNAFAYARSEAATVIEQANLTPHILTSEINRILDDEALLQRMREGAAAFDQPDAARTIATALIDIGLKHESV